MLYFKIQRLIRENCTTFGLKESKRAEFQYYFKEAKSLGQPQDVDYFLNIMNHIKTRLEAREYPPFPRFLPSVLSSEIPRDQLCYRKYIWNIDKNDLILEPGQDPVRQPFIEPKQYSSDIISDESYFKHVKKGEIFSDEELVFEYKTTEQKKSIR